MTQINRDKDIQDAVEKSALETLDTPISCNLYSNMLSSHCLPFIIFVVVVGGGGTEIQYLQISFNIFGGGGKEKQYKLMDF